MELVRSDFIKILAERFEREDVEFVNEEWVDFSHNVEGFLGQHRLLKLTYKIGNQTGTESYFIKMLPRQAGKNIELEKEIAMYKKECFLYGFILKEFKKYGLDTSFAPAGYYYKEQTYTIVLENLKEKDYIAYERGKFYDVAHSKAAVEALALLHANTIIYEEMKSKELGRAYSLLEDSQGALNEVFFIPNDTQGSAKMYIDVTKDCVRSLLELMKEPEEWKKSLLERIQHFNPATVLHQDLPTRKTCGHGDLWSNNMVFRYSHGRPTKCCLFDYQLMRYNHPAFDPLVLLYLNTTREFRSKHLTELLDHYYSSFEKTLTKHGINAREVLPQDAFKKTAKAIEPVAIFQAFAVRTFVFLPTQLTNDAVKSEDDALKGLMFSNRPKFVYEHCKKREDLKKVFLDDLYDFYKYL